MVLKVWGLVQGGPEHFRGGAGHKEKTKQQQQYADAFMLSGVMPKVSDYVNPCYKQNPDYK